MKLKIGDKAPEYNILEKYGENIILYFYPKDNTPGCTKEACSLRDGYLKLKEQGFTVIGVSPDSEQSHKKFSGKFKLPFELLADTDKKLAKKYGVWAKKNMFGREYFGIKRTTFIIESGKIKKIFKTVDTEDHANQILKALK